MELPIAQVHLTDPELFGLALPAAGEPEALPMHLSECLTCSRALQQWKLAVRELADQDAELMDKRSAEEWSVVEDRTLEAIRRASQTRRVPVLRWALPLAASLLLLALLVPGRRSNTASVAVPRDTMAQMSPQDEADDVLLREVARLARGEEAGESWSLLVPEPAADPSKGEENL